jgi:hypothetical protein
MWSALFGSSEKGILVLKPDPSAVASVHGFKGGMELRVSADSDKQTVGDLLDKFNKYRGPDQQIRHVWDLQGNPIQLGTEIRGTQTVIVKSKSIS